MGDVNSSVMAPQNNVVLPVTTKTGCNASEPNLGLQWGIGEMQGWRPSMEDAHVAMGSLSQLGRHKADSWADTGLFGVFDGHGGEQVAKFCAEHLPQAIVDGEPSKAAAVLHDSFMLMDQKLVDFGEATLPTDQWHPDYVGCTAVACLVRGDTLIVANAGDSRAVLSQNGLACDLSQDHKPDLRKEAKRIKKAGGRVFNGRVNGQLAVSRAMGDLHFKSTDLDPAHQMVSCVPDIKTCQRHVGDEFMVIACDGVWDVLTSQEVVDRVHEDLPAIRRGELQPTDVVNKILDACICSEHPANTGGKGGDNMTMILVVFDANWVPVVKVHHSIMNMCLGWIGKKGQVPGQRPGSDLLPDKAKANTPKVSRPVLLGRTSQPHPFKEAAGAPDKRVGTADIRHL